MPDWPLWAVLLVVIQVVLLLALLGLITRKQGWRKVRVGFFAEREYRDDEEE